MGGEGENAGPKHRRARARSALRDRHPGARAPGAAARPEGLDLGADRSEGALNPVTATSPVTASLGLAAVQPAQRVRQAALLLQRRARSRRRPARDGSGPRRDALGSGSPGAEQGQPAGGTSAALPALRLLPQPPAERTSGVGAGGAA